jgi:hypothetical protein
MFSRLLSRYYNADFLLPLTIVSAGVGGTWGALAGYDRSDYDKVFDSFFGGMGGIVAGGLLPSVAPVSVPTYAVYRLYRAIENGDIELSIKRK